MCVHIVSEVNIGRRMYKTKKFQKNRHFRCMLLRVRDLLFVLWTSLSPAREAIWWDSFRCS